MKTYHNSDASGASKNVKDLVIFGDGDLWKLLCKASSVKEQWMKSTKAMQIDGVGCLVQVTTQQGNNVAEAIEFVPGVVIEGDGENRKLVAMKIHKTQATTPKKKFIPPNAAMENAKKNLDKETKGI